MREAFSVPCLRPGTSILLRNHRCLDVAWRSRCLTGGPCVLMKFRNSRRDGRGNFTRRTHSNGKREPSAFTLGDRFLGSPMPRPSQTTGCFVPSHGWVAGVSLDLLASNLLVEDSIHNTQDARSHSGVSWDTNCECGVQSNESQIPVPWWFDPLRTATGVLYFIRPPAPGSSPVPHDDVMMSGAALELLPLVIRVWFS